MNEDNNVNISPNNENIEVETVNADLTDTQNISTPQKDNNKFPVLGFVYDFVEIMIIAVITVLLVFNFVFRLCEVDGSSMYDTLEDGQQVVTMGLFYKPAQGDIVVFHLTDSHNNNLNKPLVKRVIAIENQTIVIDFKSGTVTVDGKQLEEDYISLLKNVNGVYKDIGKYTETAQYNMDGYVFTLTVPEGKVFVMGDNRNDSLDSRFEVIGCVDVRRILGKVVLRVTPFNQFGFVE